jgi:hypothetical protein
MSLRFATIAIALTVGACSEPSAPAVVAPAHAITNVLTEGAPQAEQDDPEENTCSFARGTTTCVSSVQYVETTTHAEYSGCLYGPNGVPGARTRTFSDTYLVTATTTTLSRGQFGPVYDSTTVTTRVLTSSILISDVCAPI